MQTQQIGTEFEGLLEGGGAGEVEAAVVTGESTSISGAAVS